MRKALSPRRVLLIYAAATVVLLAGCAGQPPLPGLDAARISLSVPAASDWRAEDLQLNLTPAGSGWRLELTSTAARPAATLLCDLRFDPRYHATNVVRSVPRGRLDLLVANHPGVLALGVVMPAGAVIQPGKLLSAVLEPGAGPLRLASKAPQGDAGKVLDLAGTEGAAGDFTLAWSYYNTGDYDQNSEVNIADITPLALRIFESATDGDRDGLDRILDGDSNGEVNLADITPIGVNYTSLAGGYHVYRADGPDPGSATNTQLAELLFSAGVSAPDSRLAFSWTLGGDELVAGQYYYVRIFDTPGGAEGVPSNVVQYVPTVSLKFRVPPAGNSTVDGGQCQNPSLVLMPAIDGISQEGAPVIVYTRLGGGSVSTLNLAYFNGSAWTSEEIGGGDNYSMPQALWLPGEGGPPAPGSGIVVVYDVDQLRVVDRRFDENWQLAGGADVGSGDGAFSRLDLDRDPAGGGFGVAHAYTTLGGGSVFYSYTDAGGAWVTQPLYSGQAVGGLSFRFDQAGGDPWLLFTHGTATYTAGIITLDYSLEQGRLAGGNWTITPVPYPDSPLQVDLGFRADGTPQLACTAARAYTINIPTLDPITLSLLWDAATAEYSGGSWSWAKPFESSISFTFGGGFPPTTLILTLDLATDTAWAKPDELLVSRGSGSVDIDLATQLPTGGGLDSSSLSLQRQPDSQSYYDAGFFSGQAGRSFSWQVTAAGSPVCGYVEGGSLNAGDVLSGSFEPAGALLFWR